MAEPNAPAASMKQPPGLSVCFGTELFERFCFYGMRGILIFYLVSTATPFHMSQKEASLVYGSYTAMIYATNVFGGLIADKLLGFRRAVMLGGIFMAIGEFMLTVPSKASFFAGMSCMIVGCGFLKPNISAILGKLYSGPGDPRRDGGFTLFYMGINLGAFLGPIITGMFTDYRYGFAAAGVGMILAVIYFAARSHLYGSAGLPPADVSQNKAFGITALYIVGMIPAAYLLLHHEDWVGHVLNVLGVLMAAFLLGIGALEGRAALSRMIALIIMLVLNVVFWACFEQAGNSLNLFTKSNVDRVLFDFEAPAAWGQSLNAIYIVLLGIPFAKLWIKLGSRGFDPPAPVKFSLGLLQVGLGFYMLVLGAKFADNGIVPLVFLLLCYLIHTTGELCLSPVGLAAMTRLAPERFGGLVMGAWFLSTAYGNYVAGLISAIAGTKEVPTTTDGTVAATVLLPIYTDVFWLVTKIGVFIGLGALILSPLVTRLMRAGTAPAPAR